MKRDYTFYVYILTDTKKSTLYIGFTSDLSTRLKQHYENKFTRKGFTGKYKVNQLIYYEIYQYANEAIAREKQLKKWNRAKKETLIKTMNPYWNSLNHEFYLGEDN